MGRKATGHLAEMVAGFDPEASGLPELLSVPSLNAGHERTPTRLAHGSDGRGDGPAFARASARKTVARFSQEPGALRSSELAPRATAPRPCSGQTGRPYGPSTLRSFAHRKTRNPCPRAGEFRNPRSVSARITTSPGRAAKKK
jgi:hypothetical protein